jgi:hypothetical protein
VRQADIELYESLRRGEFCYILGSRQMGRSSLQMRTMQRLIDEAFACVAIDLTLIGIQDITPAQWYGALIATLTNSFRSWISQDFNWRFWIKERETLPPVKLWEEFIENVLLKEVSQNIVIFIDEIDSIFSVSFKDDFFASIRRFYNLRPSNRQYERLTFCLLGVATPSDLISDKKRTPFNIARGIELKGFELHETEPLARGLANVGNPHKLMQEILYWTGGQPFLTQKICSLAVKSNVIRPNDGYEAKWIEDLVSSEIIEDWEEQDEPEHLRTIRNRILRCSGEQSIKLLVLYQKILQQGEIIADASPEEIYLLLSGLVVKQGEKLKVYNRIYKEAFNENWVNRQLQQFALKKKILILSTNPKNISRLRLDEELREIQHGLQRSKKREQFEIISKLAVRPEDLRRALLDYEPGIVHFFAHGNGDRGLVLENNSEKLQLVSAKSLAELFKLFNNSIECVVLNGCYSETQAQAISQHINYVIGISQGIGDKAAIDFSVGFYDALGAGQSYEFAYELGCATISMENIPEHLTPVLKISKNISERNQPN